MLVSGLIDEINLLRLNVGQRIVFEPLQLGAITNLEELDLKTLQFQNRFKSTNQGSIILWIGKGGKKRKKKIRLIKTLVKKFRLRYKLELLWEREFSLKLQGGGGGRNQTLVRIYSPANKKLRDLIHGYLADTFNQILKKQIYTLNITLTRF